MRRSDLIAGLDEHDLLIVRFARGELDLCEFLRVNQSFYQYWAFDGHEGYRSLLAEFHDRIEPHRRVWVEVEGKLTTEKYARDPAVAAKGLIGPAEASCRLLAIARDAGLF